MDLFLYGRDLRHERVKDTKLFLEVGLIWKPFEKKLWIMIFG